jgi:predicted  nucleic acid-binding Zn-ribbon protein
MNDKPSFGRRLSLGLKKVGLFIYRVILITLIVGIIGVAVYLGAPVLINEYLLKDVHLNTSKIQEIESGVESNTEILSQRLSDLQTRLESLEIQNDTDNQTINDLQTRLDQAEELLIEQESTAEKLNSLELSIGEHDLTLSALDERILAVEYEISAIQLQLTDLLLSDESQQKAIETMVVNGDINSVLRDVSQELELVRIMELITRVKDDLQTAQDKIIELSTKVSEGKEVYLSGISQRLTLALANIGEDPDLADEDLEIAWQLLLKGFPDDGGLSDVKEPNQTLTPTEVEENIPTATPTSTPES